MSENRIEGEVKPDNETITKRYGHVKLGDGQNYRVVQMGAGPRFLRIDESRVALSEAFKAEDKQKQTASMVAIVHDAMNVFYSKERIDRLFDEWCIDWKEFNGIMSVLYPGDLVEETEDESKKNSQDTISTELNTQQ
jgi:hypothetical protein